MHQFAMKIWRTLKIAVVLLVLLSLVPILSGWLGDIGRDWINGTLPSARDCVLLMLAVVIILLFAYYLAHKSQQYLSVQKIKQSDKVKLRKVVITMLSPIKKPLQLIYPADDGEPSAWMLTTPEKEISLLGLTLDDVVHKEADMLRLPWQQTLRAAHHHNEKLEKLVLIGSSGKTGSGTQLELAHDFFSYYFPDKVSIMGADIEGKKFDLEWQADFENLDDLRELLAKTLKTLQKEGYKQKDIVIDCTGGQKTASIAGVLMTLDKPDLACQYVRTDGGDNTGKVLGFDAVNEPRSIQP